MKFAAGITGALACLAFVSACKSSGSVSSGGGTTSIPGVINQLVPFPTADGPSWSPRVISNVYYIKGLSLSINGACSSSIATITFNEGGPNYAETATCTAAGTFAFTKSNYGSAGQPGQGAKTINLTGLDINGNPVSGATASVQVFIDNTAPPINSPPTTAPAVATTSMAPFQYEGQTANYTITGTVSTAQGDAVSMTGPGGVNVPLSGGAFSYAITLTDNSTLSYPFTVYDEAGNTTSFTVYIEWAPTLSLVWSNTTSGGMSLTTSSNTSLTMESAIYSNGAKEADSNTFVPGDISTPVTLWSGPNGIVNEARDY